MKAILVIAMFLIALVLLLAIVLLILLWLGNAKTVLLPGVGVAVSIPLLLGMLVVLELILLISARVLWKYIS